ncbi:MAG TPA: divalent metal cation transporter, partial [candidate division Zixibacteria bacterium]|nr:divalent metal cation transporter [candidate division Zixibacteria bacterium]
RTTFLVMCALVVVNVANVAANFAGIATSLELFQISRYLAVPAGAAIVWLLVVKGTYESVEKIFLVASSFYVAYVFSAFMVEPDWETAIISSVTPAMVWDHSYVAVMIGLVGTSVAPWMQFYLQAAIVEKGVDIKQYAESRVEVIVGCVVMAVIAFFIIVSCAGAIWSHEPRDIQDASEAALALRPLGEYAYILFSAGLFNASLFAASILPLSTAYTVCEGLGFESGVNRTFHEAPAFYWLYTLLIVVGGGLVLIPGLPLVRMILWSQVLNGVLLPVILIFTLMLVNRKDLMNEWTNSTLYNIVAWVTVVVMIALSLTLAWMSL